MNEYDYNFHIQWFPGHMAKTLREMRANMKNVDVVLSILDARIPKSSRNPEIEAMIRNKYKVYLLNKADLADDAITKEWVNYFHAKGDGCIAGNAKLKSSASAVEASILRELEPFLARLKQKGTEGEKIRIMVVGIPNVGKSTFINTFAGSSRAKTGDKPGVTLGKQWIDAGHFELLDMPGVLWKKFDTNETAANLAFIGSIKPEILNIEDLAAGLVSQAASLYPEKFIQRYKLENIDLQQLAPHEIVEAVGRKRGMLVRGGEVDTERAASMLINEFRDSKWGKISLERPE